MAHKKPYRAPNTSEKVNEPGIEGRDPGGRMNANKGGGGNVSQPQYKGGVQESPEHVDDRKEHYGA